jgi:hypothetical protein
MAVAKISKALLNLASKKAKDYIKNNPGKSRVDILENLQKNFDFPLTRLKTDNARNVTKRAASHQGASLIEEIFTPNQLKKIDSEGFSVAKKQQWEKGVLGSEEHVGKLKQKRLEDIAAGKGMNLPTAGLKGSKRKWTPQLDSYIEKYTDDKGLQEVMEQALRRDKQRGLLDIAFGKGTKSQIENKQKKFLKQFQKNLLDDEFMEDYLKAATPYGKKAGRYTEDFSKLSTDEQYAEVVRNYLKSRGYSDKQIKDLFPTSFATTGHMPPVKESYADWLGFGNKASLKAFEQSADPRMWNPEFGLVNKMKGTPDPWIFKGMQNKQLSPEGLEQISRMYDAFGIQSLIRGKTIGKQNLKRQANLIDWATATPYETKLLTGRPGTGDVNKVKRMFKRMLEKGDITYEEIFAAMHKGKYPGYNKGGVVDSFMGGGIARLGIKMLERLAKKMPEEDFLKLTETLWSGVDPKKSGRYRAWAKNRWSPGYKWPYQRSRVSGRDIEKSHFASLSPAAKEALKKRYRERIDKYIKRKREEEWS